jgi:hypothetical protein
MPIDPTTDAYVLEGRVATMGRRGVIANGRINVRGRDVKLCMPAWAAAVKRLPLTVAEQAAANTLKGVL